MRKLMVLLVSMALASSVLVRADDDAAAGPKDKDIKVLNKAPEVLRALTSAPDKGIPRHLLDRAECVVVFPDVTKGAFVVGGEFGRGVATCRNGSTMSAPSMFTIGGASFGWQFGGSSSDFVLLVMDKNGMSQLLKDEFKIGGDAAVAAGPVGRNAEASTDITLRAQMLSWSRTKGLFAGVSLEGSVIKPNNDANERLYGRKVSAQEILGGRVTPTPPEASQFIQVASSVLGNGSKDVGRLDSDSDMDHEAMNHPSGAAIATTRTTPTEPKQYAATGTYGTASGRDTYNNTTGTNAGTTPYRTNETANTRSGQLPATGSKLPLIGLTGAVLIAAALWIRFRAR
jgi:SH3 domain-containing YSC84-like protein 1